MPRQQRKVAALPAVLLAAAGGLWAAQGENRVAGHGHGHGAGEAQEQVVESMAGKPMHQGPHFKWTELRPAAPGDAERAEEIVRTLRGELEKYRDYQAAIEAGYKPFLKDTPQPQVHFTNYRLGMQAAFRFDPAQPTSLLYRKKGEGFELIGAMYTAPQRTTEEELNARIPLSVVQWHQHVNICLPPLGSGKQANWRVFGPAGSIATEAECEEAGGRFKAVLFGWMVHVNPFEETAEKIWKH